MAEFKNPNLGVSFTLPEKPTLLQLLNYDEFETKPNLTMYVRLWEAAKQVIQVWECEKFDLDTSLNSLADPEALEIIKWASRAVMSWRFDLKNQGVEKN